MFYFVVRKHIFSKIQQLFICCNNCCNFICSTQTIVQKRHYSVLGSAKSDELNEVLLIQKEYINKIWSTQTETVVEQAQANNRVQTHK